MSSAPTNQVEIEDLRRIVAATIDEDADRLADDTDFVDDLGVDSLMALEVLAVLEKKYGVRFAEREMREVRTVRDAHRVVSAKLTGS
ncbi:acyl carrier protein [Saccharothrix ecbatanensis]|uniref:Acyl carrier protein n=1 Tax=Saccharothrix ecbatanensis TaxID=1105145 RepID=A0A7W9HKA6_9PSEU|nr:acyl carrier protein [Saccharothrix ecbatanensis]MBB5803641.1 acyl carrier protein [Saccharothrix ecbatanensis]